MKKVLITSVLLCSMLAFSGCSNTTIVDQEEVEGVSVDAIESSTESEFNKTEKVKSIPIVTVNNNVSIGEDTFMYGFCELKMDEASSAIYDFARYQISEEEIIILPFWLNQEEGTKYREYDDSVKEALFSKAAEKAEIGIPIILSISEMNSDDRYHLDMGIRRVALVGKDVYVETNRVGCPDTVMYDILIFSWDGRYLCNIPVNCFDGDTAYAYLDRGVFIGNLEVQDGGFNHCYMSYVYFDDSTGMVETYKYDMTEIVNCVPDKEFVNYVNSELILLTVDTSSVEVEFINQTRGMGATMNLKMDISYYIAVEFSMNGNCNAFCIDSENLKYK